MTPTQALTEALKLARGCILMDRTALADAHMCPVTNEVDAEGRDGVADYDAVLSVIDAALSAAPAAPAGEPVAWGLFAKVEDGSWNLQHPVRFSEADAKADRSMYERGTALDVRPLYAAPAPAEPAPAWQPIETEGGNDADKA